MGYFNYFVKCIIRNIAYKLCKPKVFLTVLLSICILFGLKHYGFCALSDLDYSMISDGFATITQNQGVVIGQLSSIGVDVNDLETLLTSINDDVSIIMSNTGSISSNLITVIQKINTLNTNISSIYNELDANQKELLNTLNSNNDKIITELQAENQKVLEELQQLRDALVGSESTSVSVENLGSGAVNLNGTNTPGVLRFKIPMEYKYTYKINVTYKNTSSSNKYIFYFFYDKNVTDSSELIPLDSTYAGRLDPNSSRTFTITTRDYQNPYLYLWYDIYFQDIEVTASIEGLSDTMTENNQLQQESNQLQQEQNDFLQQETTDSDVSVDGFNSVDSNDITSSGLTGIFSTIYNSINSWNSKDIVLPIPFTDKSLTIPSNYTNNMLSSVGGGSLITIISTVYYFLVARFIVYSVTGIINSIKSGSILETDTKNNITTEML